MDVREAHARAHLKRIGFPSDESIDAFINSEYRNLDRGSFSRLYELTPAMVVSLADLPQWRTHNMFVHVIVRHPVTPTSVLTSMTDAATTGLGDWYGFTERRGEYHRSPLLSYLIRHPNLDPSDRSRLLRAVPGLAGDASATERTLSSAEIDEILAQARKDADRAIPALLDARAKRAELRNRGLQEGDEVDEADARIRYFVNYLPLPIIRLDQQQDLTDKQIAEVGRIVARIGIEFSVNLDPRFVKARKALVDPKRRYAALLDPQDASALMMHAVLSD